MSEAYRKEAEMFLLPYRKAEWVLLSLSLVPLGYIFGLPLFSPSISIHAFFIFGWCDDPKVLPFFAPPFHLAVLFLTDPLYSIIPHTLGLERQNISPEDQAVCSACLA